MVPFAVESDSCESSPKHNIDIMHSQDNTMRDPVKTPVKNAEKPPSKSSKAMDSSYMTHDTKSDLPHNADIGTRKRSFKSTKDRIASEKNSEKK